MSDDSWSEDVRTTTYALLETELPEGATVVSERPWPQNVQSTRISDTAMVYTEMSVKKPKPFFVYVVGEWEEM